MANAVQSTSTIPLPDLKAHLETQYGIAVSQIAQLDLIVYRIDRSNGPSWVARVFDSTCPIRIVEGDAEILLFLEQQSFPAERCTNPEPVSTTLSGHHVLVTEFVDGRRPRKGEQLFPRLGELLGRVQTMDTRDAKVLARRGGAWHHLCQEGGPREEFQKTLAMLREFKEKVPVHQYGMYQNVQAKLEGMDDFDDLPHAFIHPDLVPSNVITTNSGELIVVDWAGAGTGPRIASLGFLLWAAGNKSMTQVEAVARSYSKHVQLTDEELARLAGAIWFRPFVLRCWEVCTGRTKLEDVVERIAKTEELAKRIASVAGKVLVEERKS